MRPGPLTAAARPAAAPQPIVGADRIARLVIGLREKFWAANRTMQVATVNGETGLCIRDGGRLTATMSIATDGEQILAVYAVVNPDKLVIDEAVTRRAFTPTRLRVFSMDRSRGD